MYFVYVIRYSNGRTVHHYCGIALDPAARLEQHRNGDGAKALRGKAPLHMVWQSPHPLPKGAALKVEHAIKRLPPQVKAQSVAPGANYERTALMHIWRRQFQTLKKPDEN